MICEPERIQATMDYLLVTSITIGCTIFSVAVTYIATLYKMGGAFMKRKEWQGLHTDCNNAMCEKLDQNIAATGAVQLEVNKGSDEFKFLRVLVTEIATKQGIQAEHIASLRENIMKERGEK